MNFKFSKTKVLGISTVVPKRELSLIDDEQLYNGDSKRIQRVINSSGFLKRRINDIDVMTSDLCEKAANDLLSKLNIKREKISALLFISYTPDYLMPATSYVLHGKLGLSKKCVVMDIPQACSGFVLGLYQASMLINAGCENVLLLVGDSFSKFSDMFIDHTAPVFGDAGSATLMSYDENASDIYFNIQSDGKNYDSLMCSNGGFRNIPTKADFYDDGKYKYNSKMHGGRIFDFTMQEIAPSIEELLAFSKIKKNDINYYVFHQANKFILQNLARQLEIDIDKVPMETLTKYGNQCGASIPSAISDALSEIVSKNNNKLLISGFGVGLSWANAILDLNNIYCSKVKEYESSE